jgi:hypothetical protein
MTISQLIEALELARNQYGDLHVIVSDHYGASGEEFFSHISGVRPTTGNGNEYLEIVNSDIEA